MILSRNRRRRAGVMNGSASRRFRILNVRMNQKGECLIAGIAAMFCDWGLGLVQAFDQNGYGVCV